MTLGLADGAKPLRLKSLLWSPTIALAWLWGLGFFYSMHAAITQGWAGFLAFAVPNALGLAGFGAVLDRRVPGDLERPFLAAASGKLGALLGYQALAIGITVFAMLTCLGNELLGRLAIPAVLLLALAAMATGQVLSLQALKRLHIGALVIGAAAAIGTLLGMPALTEPSVATHAEGPALGLIVPTLVGFLLGPWLDLQHWHRAVQIRREGGSLTLAYGVGGLMFFALITVNAAIAIGLPASAMGFMHMDFGHVPDAAQLVGWALGRAGGAPAGLFLVWAAVAMVTTLDSGWSATRWFMTAVTRDAKNPLLAMVPPGLVQTPLWVFLAAGGIAAGATLGNASLLDLMAPYATIFIGYAACLALAVSGRRTGADATFCCLLGLVSATLFGIGYFLVPAHEGWLTTVAPLVPLMAVLPMSVRATPVLAEPVTAASSSAVPVAIPAAIRESMVVPASAQDTASGLASTKGWFEDNWFNIAYTPTYDDTNSVGNVYFANYLRWVGKAREMFFFQVLPGFDLKHTAYFILTRSIAHDFLSEAREFESAVIRLRIGKYNRKFATLEHEIRTEDGRVLGRGEQKLMFVDSAGYRLIDIPGEVLTACLPYTVAKAG